MVTQAMKGGESYAMRSLGERIQRQRVAISGENEKVLLTPRDVDRVVKALMFAATMRHAFVELEGNHNGTGEWLGLDGEWFGGLAGDRSPP